MMKKIISVIIMLSMFLGINIHVMSAPENIEFTKKQQLLIDALRLSEVEVEDESGITRAEFAKILITAAYDDITSYSAVEDTFFDVTDAHDYYKEIMILRDLGVVKGSGNNNFNPEDKITLEQALTMAERLASYDINWHEDYKSAVKSRLSEKVSVNGSNLPLSAAFMIVCNMMELDVYGLYYDNDKAKTYMEQQRKLYYIKGVVTDDGEISLSGESQNAGHINIDDAEFLNKTGKTELFGFAVEGYYKADGDENILLSVEKSKKNNEIFIESRNIEKYDAEKREYEYFENETDVRTKKVAIPTDIIPVYNGMPISIDDEKFSEKSFLPEYGTVRILDNNNDEIYDFIFIDEYDTGVVSGVSEEEEKIYFKNVLGYLELEEKEYEISDIDGNEKNLSELKENDILSIRESLDGKRYKILVSNIVTQDVCESIDREEESIDTKTGGLYHFSDYYERIFGIELLKIGRAYSFYFDVFGNVAQITSSDESNWNAGYLFNAIASEEEDFIVKICDMNGEKRMFNLADTVKIYLPDNTVKNYKKEIAVDVINQNATDLFGEAGDKYSALIRYRQNMRQEIVQIELPLDKNVDLSELKEERLFVLHDASISGAHYNSLSFGAKFAINDSTGILLVDNKEKEGIKGTSSLFLADAKYNVVAYATDKDTNVAKYMTVVSADKLDTQVRKKIYFAISDIYTEYDEAEDATVTILKGYNNSTEATFKIEDEDVIKNAKNLSGDSCKIERGDIVALFASSKNNYVTGIIQIYDYNGTGINGKGNFDCDKGWLAGSKRSTYSGKASDLGIPARFNNNTLALLDGGMEYFDANTRITLGYVYTRTSNFVSVTTQNLGSGKKYMHNYDSTLYTTELFDRSVGGFVKLKEGAKGKIEIQKASVNDIKPYTEYGQDVSKLLVLYSKYRPDMVYIIE